MVMLALKELARAWIDSMVRTLLRAAATVEDGYRYWFLYLAKSCASFDHGKTLAETGFVVFVRSTHMTSGNCSLTVKPGAEVRRAVIAQAIVRIFMPPSG